MNQLDDAVVALASVTSWPLTDLLAMTARDFVGYLAATARLHKRSD